MTKFQILVTMQISIVAALAGGFIAGKLLADEYPPSGPVEPTNIIVECPSFGTGDELQSLPEVIRP